MPKDLNETQRVILTTAGARNDLSVMPLAPSIRAEADAVRRDIKALLKAGLIREQPATDAAVAWTRREGTSGTMLVTTRKGLAAVGIGNEVGPIERTEPTSATKKHAKSAPRKSGSTEPGTSKLSLLIMLLEQPEGATLAELTEATGWQSHSVRGAMSGALRKKRGLDLVSDVVPERGRVYRIARSPNIPLNEKDGE